MTSRYALLPYALAIVLGFSLAGCQSLAVAMDGPWFYSDPPSVTDGPAFNCAAQIRDAATWGTLPSAWCSPSGPPLYWSRPAGFYPYNYGRPYGRAWRGPGYHYGAYRSGHGGWRGGRGGRR